MSQLEVKEMHSPRQRREPLEDEKVPSLHVPCHLLHIPHLHGSMIVWAILRAIVLDSSEEACQ